MPLDTRPPYPYDCLLNGTGLLLERGVGGQLAWRERRLPFFPPRVSPADAAYARYPLDDEALWAVDDLSGGFGRRIDRRDDAARYSHGFADTRIPRQVTLPPQVTTTPVVFAGPIVDHFELAGRLYALAGSAVYRTVNGAVWTLVKAFAPGAAARSAAVFQGRAARPRAFVALGGRPTDPPFWTFDGDVWTEHPGQPAPVGAFLLTRDSGATLTDLTAAAAGQDPAARANVGALHPRGSGQWLLVGHPQRFAALAVQVNPTRNLRRAALAAEFWNGAAWAPVAGLTDGTAEGGVTLAADGEVRFEEPRAWPLAQLHGRRAYWLRLSVSGRVSSATRIGRLRALEVRRADLFAAAGAVLARVSSETGAPMLSTCADGGAASTWTPGAAVGDGMFAARSLHALGGGVQVVKDDGLFTRGRAASSGDLAQTQRWPSAAATDPILGGAAEWRGSLWLPAPPGFARWRAGTLTLVGPEQGSENDSPLRGRVTACAGDDHFMYAALQDGAGRSYLLAFDPERGSWHPLADLGRGTCRHLWVSDLPGPNPRLYVGVGRRAASLVLPRESANPLHDPNCRYAARADLHLPRFQADFAAQAKAYLAVALTGERLSPSTPVDAAYRLADGEAFTALGRVAASGQRLEFGAGASGEFIDLRLSLASGDPAATPVVRSAALAYALRPEFKRVFEFQARVADGQTLNDGRLDARPGRAVKRAIAAAAAARAPVLLISPDGEHLRVLVRDAEARAQRRAAGRGLAWVMPVTATEHRETAGAGTHNRLAAYTHQAQAVYLHTQLVEL